MREALLEHEERNQQKCSVPQPTLQANTASPCGGYDRQNTGDQGHQPLAARRPDQDGLEDDEPRGKQALSDHEISTSPLAIWSGEMLRTSDGNFAEPPFTTSRQT